MTVPPTLLAGELYARALSVGRGAAGVSGPNPPVGCIIVRDGELVGEGSTSPAGGPHAEVVALRAAGTAARGATAVVTLEPCAHEGRTAPCTDALLVAGIAEVHVLMRDPDPLAAGGLDVLRARGVRTVDVGELRASLAAAAAFDLRGFLARVHHGRPHVTLKLAQTVDGTTVPPAGAYLTGMGARTRVHQMRAASDAVLVGSGTVAADDPRLDVRFPDPVDGSARQPRPVILASRAEVMITARAVRPGTVVVVGPDAPDGRRVALIATGATVVEVARDISGARLDVRAALCALLEQRILTVLAEPGPLLANALLEAGVVDVIELHVADGVGAREPLRAALPALARLVAPDASSATVERIETEDGDVVLRLDLTVARPEQLEEVA